MEKVDRAPGYSYKQIVPKYFALQRRARACGHGLKALLFGVVASLLIACSEAPQGTQKADTINIGMAGVQTGSDGALGLSMVNGSLIATEEWNAKGGVLGKKINPLLVDDEGKAEKAVNVANDLISKKAVAVLGHFNSSCTIATMGLYHDAHMLQITPGSTNTKITQQGIKTLFRLVGRDAQQAEVNVDFLYNTLGLRKLAVLHNTTSWGEGIATEVRDLWLKKGGEVVEFTGLNESDRDFAANLANVKSKGAQAVYGGLMYAQSGPLVKKMREEGVNIPFASGDGSFDPEFIKSTGQWSSNVFLTFGPDLETSPTAMAFTTKYRERFKADPGPYAIYGYDAANVLLTAIQEAGTTDAEKVAEVMHTKSFNTSQGEIAFDENGDLKKTYFIIWTVKEGKFVPNRP